MCKRRLARAAAALVLTLGLNAFGAEALPSSAAPDGTAVPISPGDNSPSSLGYDVAPAMARLARARAAYDAANQQLDATIAVARQMFYDSTAYRNAERELREAQDIYTWASQVVLSNVDAQPRHHDLIVRRTELDVAINSTLPGSPLRIKLAEKRLQIAAQASRMEADALAADPTVQEAKVRLAAAQQVLSEMKQHFEATLMQQPQVVAAQSAVTAARVALAEAEEYLRGVAIMRQDALDLAAQQAAVEQTQALNQPPYWGWYPYGYGYYGIGGVVITRSGNHSGWHNGGHGGER